MDTTRKTTTKKVKDRPMKVVGKKYPGVSELVRDTCEPEFADEDSRKLQLVVELVRVDRPAHLVLSAAGHAQIDQLAFDLHEFSFQGIAGGPSAGPISESAPAVAI